MQHVCMQLLLEVPTKFSIFSPEAFSEPPSALPEASVEDVLRLPAPLCRAWFQQIRTLSVHINCSSSPDSLSASHRSELIFAVGFAGELRQLSIEAVSAGRNCRHSLSSLLGTVKRENNKGGGRQKSSAKGSVANMLTKSFCANKNGASTSAGCSGGGGVMPSQHALGEAGRGGGSGGGLQHGMCTFKDVKNCLLGKPHLKVLKLHGVDVLPSDLTDFATIMQQRCGPGRSLESLTLCRCCFEAYLHPCLFCDEGFLWCFSSPYYHLS